MLLGLSVEMQFNPVSNKQANKVIFSGKPSLNNLSYQLSNLIIMAFLNGGHLETLRNHFRFKTQLQCSYRSKY